MPGALLVLLFTFVSFNLNAQTFKINQVSYDMPRTEVSAFERYFGSFANREFASQEELDKFLADLRELMYRSDMFRTFEVVTELQGGVTDGVQNINLNISLEETWPAVGVVVPFYMTSVGFVVGGGGIFPNVSGYLFDILTNFSYNAEPRGSGLSWSDPIYKGGIAFSKIPLGYNLFLGIASDIIRNSNTIKDRGREVYTYKALSLDNELSLLWRPNLNWSLLNTIRYKAGFMPVVDYNAGTGEDYGVPSKNYFLQKLRLSLDHSVQTQDGMSVGLLFETMIGYSFDQGFNNTIDHAFLGSFLLDYTWNVHDIFYPRLAVYTYYKTGRPEFNLAREMRGIVDGEWRGNGVTRFSADFLFYIYQLPSWFAIHMGPYFDYGFSYGQKQAFLKNDQGWTFGLRIKGFTPLAPSTPVFVDLGFDLRDKYSWKDIGKHFELTISSTFSI